MNYGKIKNTKISLIHIKIIQEKIFTHVIGAQLVLSLGIIGYRKHAGKLISYIEKRVDCKVNFIYHPTKKLQDNRATNNLSEASLVAP